MAISSSARRNFAIQFQSPPIGGGGEKVIPGRRVRVEFDLSRMVVDGKLSY
jgi:hypothetical protein